MLNYSFLVRDVNRNDVQRQIYESEQGNYT